MIYEERIDAEVTMESLRKQNQKEGEVATHRNTKMRIEEAREERLDNACAVLP